MAAPACPSTPPPALNCRGVTNNGSEPLKMGRKTEEAAVSCSCAIFEAQCVHAARA